LSDLIGAPQDVQGHAALDAAGQVQILALGMDRARAAAIPVLDGQQRRVADQPGQ
jgi:hypothetical protein